jgi:hypothetical protein
VSGTKKRQQKRKRFAPLAVVDRIDQPLLELIHHIELINHCSN